MNYSWRYWIETFLSYSESSKKTLLETELYYPETDYEANKYKSEGQDKTPTLQARKELIAGSKLVFFSTRLSLDLANSDKYWPPQMSFKWRFIRSRPSMGLLYDPAGNKEYKIVLESLKLQVRKIMTAPSVRAAYFNNIKSNIPAYLPFKVSKKIFLKNFF